jgi:hypothetical protein
MPKFKSELELLEYLNEAASLHYANKVQGYTQERVGELYGRSQSWANQRIQTIEKEIQSLMDIHPNKTYEQVRIMYYQQLKRSLEWEKSK